MRKHFKIIFTLLLLSLVVSAYWLIAYPRHPTHIHNHAGFRVYIDNQLQDYSDYKYMNFVPCSEHDTKKSKEEEQIEKAHLHDNVGDVVHVHREGSIWGDLFTNMQVMLPKDKELIGYINGTKIENIMNQPIDPYSTAIFIIGKNDGDHGNEIVGIDHIKEVEAKSELCGSDR